MNQLYPFVETVIKNYSHEALLNLFQQLEQRPGEGQDPVINCSTNAGYVIKRFISGCLSKEGDIKFNSYFALSTLLLQFPLSRQTNIGAVVEFVLTQSDIKKNCGGKSSEIQAYAVGKILIVKALGSLLQNNLEIINHLIELSTEHQDLQEQIIEVVCSLSTDKKAQLAFSKMTPNTKAGFVLFTILRNKLKGTEHNLNQAAVQDVILELTSQYPKRSIVLTHLGKELRNFSKNSAEFLQSLFDSALEPEEPNVKKLFYILELLQFHLSDLVISAENAQTLISPPLLSSWLSQLKVQNKYIRKQASNIKIVFADNSDFAFEVLKQIHEASINLSNINIKHPLFHLFETVDAERYLEYLFGRCSDQDNEMETEQSFDPPLNELQFFITIAQDKLKAESLAKAVELFLKLYTSDKKETILQTLMSIFNSFLPHHHMKKEKLLVKPSLILAKLNFEALTLENSEQIKEIFKAIRKYFKEEKEEHSPILVSYLNFMVNVGFYFLMYPEEAEMFEDLKMAFEDIKKNFINEQAGMVPHKKKKLNPENERNKPIHILVDIFVSLLTKSPHFLRNAVNNLFEQIIPFLGSEDLQLLLGVVQKDDQQFLEEEHDD